MSSETRFSTSHSSFWNALLPMGEAYIRAQNAKLERFAPALVSYVSADQRGIINEGAFLIFQEAMRLSRHPSSLLRAEVETLLYQAVEYVARLLPKGPVATEDISDAGYCDAILIAERLHAFFAEGIGDVVVRPAFPGCGWVDDAEGDVLCGSTLYEVKAGQRHFRLADVRQVLCYCALDFSSKGYGIRSVSLVNPRAGIVIREDLESLCLRLSGTGSNEVLGEIISYISEPFSRYQAG
jgi:hypothetical protein